jgi:hypothetical protein
MSYDLRQLIRATFNNAMLFHRDSEAAFNRAVEMLLRRRPLLNIEEARKIVAEAIDCDAVAG